MKKKQEALDICDNILTMLHLLEDYLYGPDFDQADRKLAEDLAPIRTQLGTAREKYKEDKGEIMHVPAIKEEELMGPRFPYEDF